MKVSTTLRKLGFILNILLAYDNARLIRVPIAQIIDKKERVQYKRNKNKVVFACPAKKTDIIYTEVKGPNDNNFIRVDDVLKIKEGKITDGGERISVVLNNTWCAKESEYILKLLNK